MTSGERYVYLDSSALVKLVVREPEWQALRLYLGQFPLRATSVLSTVEVPRAVARHLQRFEPRSVEVFRAVEILPFDRPLASAAVHLPRLELRSLDAVHLASAMTLAPDLESLVTYDTRLADAAQLVGIRVVEPH